MRYPSDHKAAVRARIIKAAAEALRRDGLSGVSIPALMSEVGLTHGGFYSHFQSRDELVAEAVRAAAQETGKKVFGELPLAESLAMYLSPMHVERPSSGCVVAALGTEAPRQNEPVQQAFAEAALGLLQLVEKKTHPDNQTPALHPDTLRLVSQMVGAVLLSRLIGDPELTRQLLSAARQT